MSLKERWSRHCSHANDPNPTGLHAAIKKYGKENFSIRVIEECATKELLNKREVFWIAYYNTFHGEGYNRSLGGEGLPILDLPMDDIIKDYQNGITMETLGQKYGCCAKTISRRLKEYNAIPPTRKGIFTEQQRKNLEKGWVGRPENFTAHIEKLKKKIIQMDANGNILNEFTSLSDACRSLNKPTNHTNRLSKAAEEGRLFWGYYWALQ